MRPPDCAHFATLPPGGVFSDTFAITPEYYGILPTGRYTMAVAYYNWHSGCYLPTYPYPPAADLGAWTGLLYTNPITVDVRRMVYLPLILRD